MTNNEEYGIGGFLKETPNGIEFLNIRSLGSKVYPFISDPIAAPSSINDLPMPDELLSTYAKLFDPKATNALPYHRPQDCIIELLPDAQPVYGRVYNLTPEEDIQMKEFVNKNLRSGFIQKSSSPYGAPCFFTKKKSGSLRLCVDYRALNKITKKDRNPLPLISDILRSLCKAVVFTALDLKGAYNLLRIKAGEEEKTAFLTKYGQYEFLVMPFGLTNAPAQFQKFMNELFRGKIGQYVVVYLDDIVIYSESDADHWDHVRAVLDILLQNNLFCAREKCFFGKRSLTFLGYEISASGVNMDTKKISSVLDWPIPKSVKEIQTFLGFTNFYRRLIKNYASLAAPLTSLLKLTASFEDFDVKTFLTLKSCFAEPAFLAHPNESKPFIVETDASDFALGAILSQYDDCQVLRPIAFYSRQFTPAELNYEVYDKELLAIHAAFKEWRHFLQGGHHQTSVLSDHHSLQYFMTSKQLTRRQARWSLFLNEFNFVLSHRPGTMNGKPDGLSRRPDWTSHAAGEKDNFIQLFKPHQVDSSIAVNALTSYDTLHARFGHIGKHTLVESLKATEGSTLSGPIPITLCEPCETGKSTRSNVPRTSTHKRDLLEVIESDSQGPFPIKAFDGSNSNIKFVDVASNYIKMETLPSGKASAALAAFVRFKNRLEKQTGKTIKRIRTDQGTEFKKEFLDFISSEGIVKETGFPYFHTHPGKAERSHQSIMYRARAMLIASKLPVMFYAEAQLTAAYIHNRIIHGKDSKTPYEHIYGRRPLTSHLRPFGCVAFAHIPKELRSKLQPSAERCRLLGYLDDDDTEELLGYKLLRESDLAIIHSRDVRFDEASAMEPLSQSSLYDDLIHGEDLFGDSTFQPQSDPGEGDATVGIKGSASSHTPHYETTLVSPKNILGRPRRPNLNVG